MQVMYTPEQYEALMKLVYLGNWMVNGIKTSDERTKKFDAIEQRIFQDAEDAGCGSLSEYDEPLKNIFPHRRSKKIQKLLARKKNIIPKYFGRSLLSV